MTLNGMFLKTLFVQFLTLGSVLIFAVPFHLTVIKYEGGGDWYEGKVGVQNLMSFLKTNTSLTPEPLPRVIELTDPFLSKEPFLYLTGHGNVSFNAQEIAALRQTLLEGNFLFVDDDFGLDPFIRRELKKVFPEKEWVELGRDHMLFHQYFEFPEGLPKIHEHTGRPPQALALFHRGRMMVLYTFESNIGDGWAPFEVHQDPPEKRLAALKFGVNLILYSMTR